MLRLEVSRSSSDRRFASDWLTTMATWLPGSQWMEKIATWLMVISAGGFVGLIYWIAYRRLRYPNELEWAEGGMIDMVRRVAAHQSLYTAPSKLFVPYMYTPLYYYASAALGHFTGIHLSTLRLVSLAASTGCLILIFLLVRQWTGKLLPATFACGLFAALDAVAHYWFDLGRVDMLYLFFILAAILLARDGRSILAAIAFALAFDTKQTALVVAVCVLAHELDRPRKLLQGLLTFAALAGASVWFLNHQTQGWFSYYAFRLPSHQAWMVHKLGSFLLRDLVFPLSISLVLIVAACAFKPASFVRNPRQLLFLLFTTAGLGISCITARLHLGGTNNVTLPLWAWICILAALSLHSLLEATNEMESSVGAKLRLVLMTACLLQFLQLVESPSQYVPTHQQQLLAQQMNQKIAAIQGNVFVVHNVVDAGSAGKATYANSMAIWDVLRADRGPAAQNLRTELIQSFQQKEFSAVLADASPDLMMPVEEPYLTDINHAATVAYPQEQQTMPPWDQMLFYTSPDTPGMKPNVLFLPQSH